MQASGVPGDGANVVGTARATQQPGAAATPRPAVTRAPTAQPAGPKRFGVGETVTVTSNGREWAEIVVTESSTAQRYRGEYSDDTPGAGNVYLQVHVTYTALVDGVTYNPFDWQVFVDGSAVQNYSFVLYGPEPELSSGTLPAGRRASGWLIYEVPTRGEVLLSYGGYFGNSAPVFEVVVRGS